MKIKLEEWAQIPFKKHEYDAGWDLYSPETFIVEPGKSSHRINLGVAVEIPEGYCGEVLERSSQGAKGIGSLGRIVDTGYTGNIHVTLFNSGPENYVVEKGDRICQLIVKKILIDELEIVDELDKTERGDGAHGSTGK